MRISLIFWLGLVVLGCPPTRADETRPLHLDYETYALGVEVAELSAGFVLGRRDYQIDLAFHTTGLIGAMFGGHQKSSVAGVWEGDRPEPLRFVGDGFWHGQSRRIEIDYQAGHPMIRRLVPLNDKERDPVPVELQARSVDTLSALALLMRRVARTGRCETEIVTFDGRRAVGMRARTGPEETLSPTKGSSFAGPALRCDFEGHLLAGFPRDGDRAELRRPKRGSAWFARVVPGAPPLPVRISFETRWFGDATMYLTGAGWGASPSR